MKLIIVGAGASFDSIYLDSAKNVEKKIIWKPPLGKDLFNYTTVYNKILRSYPGAESFRSEVDACQDIEEYFQRKYELSKGPNGFNLALQLINVQFYLQHLFLQISDTYLDFGPSNYDILVSKAYEYYLRTADEVVFVTFNYDTLLESSLEKICGVRIDSIQDYIKYPLKIIKPHGSCNWYRHVKPLVNLDYALIKSEGLAKYLSNPNRATKIIDILNSLEEETSIFRGSERMLREGSKDNMYFPQIVIPLKSKDEFLLPESHLRILQSAVETTYDILIIGWKVNEARFLDLLKMKLPNKGIKITYVCGSDDSIKGKLSNLIPGCHLNRFYVPINKTVPSKMEGTFSLFARSYIDTKPYNFFGTN